MKICFLFLVFTFSSVLFAGRLHLAVWQGDLEAVERLLKEDEPDWLDEEGNTPLHIAAEINRIDIFLALFTENARGRAAIDVFNQRRERPIDVAARCHSEDIIQFTYTEHFGVNWPLAWIDRIQVARLLGNEGGIAAEGWPIPASHEPFLAQRLVRDAQAVGVYPNENLVLDPYQLEFLKQLIIDLDDLKTYSPTISQEHPWTFIARRILRQIHAVTLLGPKIDRDPKYFEQAIIQRLQLLFKHRMPSVLTREVSYHHHWLSKKPLPSSCLELLVELVDLITKNGFSIDPVGLGNVLSRLQSRYHFYKRQVPLEYVLQAAQNLASRPEGPIEDSELETIARELVHMGIYAGRLEYDLRRFSAQQLREARRTALEDPAQLRRLYYAGIPWDSLVRLARTLFQNAKQVGREELQAVVGGIRDLIRPLEELVRLEAGESLSLPAAYPDVSRLVEFSSKQADLDGLMKIVRTLDAFRKDFSSMPRARWVAAYVRLLEILGEFNKNCNLPFKAEFQILEDIRDFFAHLDQQDRFEKWQQFQVTQEMTLIVQQFVAEDWPRLRQFYVQTYEAILRGAPSPQAVPFASAERLARMLDARISQRDKERLRQSVPYQPDAWSRIAVSIIWQFEENRLSRPLGLLLADVDELPLSGSEKGILKARLTKLQLERLSKYEVEECMKILNGKSAQETIWSHGDRIKFNQKLDARIGSLASGGELHQLLRPFRELGVTDTALLEGLHHDLNWFEPGDKKRSKNFFIRQMQDACAQAQIILKQLDNMFRGLTPEFRNLAKQKKLPEIRVLVKEFQKEPLQGMACEHLLGSIREFSKSLRDYLRDISGGAHEAGDMFNLHLECLASELEYLMDSSNSYLHLHSVTEINPPTDRLVFILMRLLFKGLVPMKEDHIAILSPSFTKSLHRYLTEFVHVMTEMVQELEKTGVPEWNDIEPRELEERFKVARNAKLTSNSVRRVAAPDYWYDETDLQQALTLRLQQAGVDLTRADLVVLPAVGGVAFGDQIRTHLREEWQLRRAATRTIVVPYNIGNYHWIGILIQVGPEGVVFEIMDPRGDHTQVPTYIWRELREVYPQAQFADGRYLVQPDNYNCGPLTVENLVQGVMRVQGAAVPADAPARADLIRMQQIDLLRTVGHLVDRLIVLTPGFAATKASTVSS